MTLAHALEHEFEVRWRMLSDWHSGTGAGRPGDVDRLVSRDSDGLPYLRAKTLTGIWRDACESVARGLDGGVPGGWTAWVDHLFGDQPALAGRDGEVPARRGRPRPAAVSVRSAHLRPALARALCSDRRLLRAVTFVQPGVRIDPHTGQALDDHLRFQEMARTGATMTSRVAWTPPPEERQRIAATALLVAGATWIERLGGKRRRGAGRVEVRVGGFVSAADRDAFFQWIEENPPPPVPSEPDPQAGPAVEIPESPSRDDWRVIDLTLVTRSAVVVSDRVVGNVVESLDFIPGSHLLSGISRVLRRAATGDGGQRGSQVHDTLRAAVASGSLVVTNATLEVDGARGRAVPLTLFHEKVGGGLARGHGVLNRMAEAGAGQLKQHRDGWLGASRGGELPAFDEVLLTVNTHNSVDDEPQRPTENVGGVYSFEAIPGGRRFQAQLRVTRTVAERLAELRPSWWRDIGDLDRVGRARKDDYGRVEVHASEPRPADTLSTSHQAGRREVRVWLLSDLLVNDPWLRPMGGIDGLLAALESPTGLGVKVALRSAFARDCIVASVRERRIESWQTSWGLPRPTLVGLRAGSCAVLELTDDPPSDFAARIARVEVEGLGLRRAEGFGQVCFDDALLATPLAGLSSSPRIEFRGEPLSPSGRAELDPSSVDPDDLKFARNVEREAWRRAIAVESLTLASSPATREELLGFTVSAAGEGKPRNSQIAAFRSAIGRLHRANDAEQFRGWLRAVRAKPARANGWPPGSVKPVRDSGEEKSKLERLVEPGEIWRMLASARLADMVTTHDGRPRLEAELWAEAIRTLVDACVRAHRRDLERPKRAGDARDPRSNAAPRTRTEVDRHGA